VMKITEYSFLILIPLKQKNLRTSRRGSDQ
jgi:hypothetical protein